MEKPRDAPGPRAFAPRRAASPRARNPAKGFARNRYARRDTASRRVVSVRQRSGSPKVPKRRGVKLAKSANGHCALRSRPCTAAKTGHRSSGFGASFSALGSAAAAVRMLSLTRGPGFIAPPRAHNHH